MASIDTYITISAPSEGLFKDKGSRFMAYAYPVSDSSQVKNLVDNLKKIHHGARHHCFAYRMGNDGSVFRANDDGEPSGSAGKPILAAIDSAGVSDTLVVVVRYFGGILLGVPGLVRAYREAAADALSQVGKVEKTLESFLDINFGYEQTDDVQRLLGKVEGTRILKRDFGMDCKMTVAVPFSEREIMIENFEQYNNEKGTRIQCRPLQTAPSGN